MNETIFFLCGSALLLLNLLISCREALAKFRVLCKTINLKRLKELVADARKADPKEAFILKEMCQRKVMWAQRFLYYLNTVWAVDMTLLLYMTWAQNSFMSAEGAWSIALVCDKFSSLRGTMVDHKLDLRLGVPCGPCIRGLLDVPLWLLLLRKRLYFAAHWPGTGASSGDCGRQTLCCGTTWSGNDVWGDSLSLVYWDGLLEILNFRPLRLVELADLVLFQPLLLRPVIA